MGLNRRAFLRNFGLQVGAGVTSLAGVSVFSGLSGCASGLIRSPASRGEQDSSVWLSQVSPISRSNFEIPQQQFTGDSFDLPHALIRDGSLIPKSPSSAYEDVEVVVLGGGMSGLLSAYLLRNERPLVLEMAPRFGGNSKGESWKGIDYSIGAAYALVPEAGSPIESLWKEIGVDRLYRSFSGSEPLHISGVLYPNCWRDGTVWESQKQFQALSKLLENLVREQDGEVFPDIPIRNPAFRKKIDQLDLQTFGDYLRAKLGGPLHPHLEEYLEHYCWSSFAGSMNEVSAAAGINFFASDIDASAVFPGGNAAIAEQLLKKCSEKIGVERLRTRSTVYDVEVDGAFVWVRYLDQSGVSKQVRARRVICALPKFVAARVIRGLEDSRLRAIRQIKYRSYLVANVLIDQELSAYSPVKSAGGFYDAYFYEGSAHGPRDVTQIPGLARKQGATDVIWGNYATPSVRGQTVLTLSRAIPYEGGRYELQRSDAFSVYRSEFENQLFQTVFPAMGLNRAKVRDIRLTRWGHPLPLAAVGNIASGLVETVHQPFKNQVFFVEQDNWTLPCFETAFWEAKKWTDALKKS